MNFVFPPPDLYFSSSHYDVHQSCTSLLFIDCKSLIPYLSSYWRIVWSEANYMGYSVHNRIMKWIYNRLINIINNNVFSDVLESIIDTSARNFVFPVPHVRFERTAPQRAGRGFLFVITKGRLPHKYLSNVEVESRFHSIDRRRAILTEVFHGFS
jgi:hypothetical protein